MTGTTAETTTPASDGSPVPLPLDPGRWKADMAHSSVTFSVRHLGLAKVRGRFNTFEAWIDVGDSIGSTRVEAAIDMASLDTNDEARDGHLRTGEMLDVDTHPWMRFVSTAITGDGADWRMEGELTVMDKVSTVAFDLEYTGTEWLPQEILDALGIGPTRHAGFSARGELKRSELGLDLDLPAALGAMLGDRIQFELDFEFVEPST